MDMGMIGFDEIAIPLGA